MVVEQRPRYGVKPSPAQPSSTADSHADGRFCPREPAARKLCASSPRQAEGAPRHREGVRWRRTATRSRPGARPLPLSCAALRTAEPELLATLRQADALVVTVLAAGGTK
ncbi:hypothetical protein, partial [Nocardia brasiliensis]|uniref:hypothetical protein n=1 Tax=Nocardia brasiliensis TaxID=37326 RepID=UPI0024558907